MANILVIDDDVDVLPLMKMTLTKMGHATTVASRGEEGLATALVGQYDLIILDLMMPDIDGYEVTRRLRANPRTRDLPILILTARTQLADHQSAMQAGADSYIGKPFDAEELSTTINDLVKAGQVRLQAAQARSATPLGRVLVVLGLRGGVGVTTLAVNAAGGLVRAGRRVCLFDLSPSGGHAALHLRLRPQPTWADLPNPPSSAPNALTAASLSPLLLHHDSGLFLMAAPSQPVRKGLAGEVFVHTLEVLRTMFTDVVIDSAPWLDDATSHGLSAARQILLVLSPEVGAVQTTLGTLRVLAGLSLSDDQIRIALNHTSPEPGLAPAGVERALGRAPDILIPYDRAQAPALAQGTPLVFSQPGAPLAAAVGAFAANL